MLRHALVSALLLCRFATHSDGADLAAVSIRDLAGRTEISRIAVSPTGTHVAFLTSRADINHDEYQIGVFLQELSEDSKPQLLADYRLAPQRVVNPDNMFLLSTAGQIRWAPDGRTLAYTDHGAQGMRLWLLKPADGAKRLVAEGHYRIELLEDEPSALQFASWDSAAGADVPSARREAPPNLALLVLESHRFLRPLENPHTRPLYHKRQWRCDWQSGVLTRDSGASTVEPILEGPVWPPPWWNRGVSSIRIHRDKHEERVEYPGVLSPRLRREAFWQTTRSGLDDPAKAVSTSRFVIRNVDGSTAYTEEHTAFGPRDVIAWRGDDIVFFIETLPQSGAIRKLDLTNGRPVDIVRDNAAFRVGGTFGELPANVDAQRRKLVLIRETNTTPDELVMVDLQSGRAHTLYAPNAIFAQRAQPQIRFIPMPNELGRVPLYGRLYLPPVREPGKKYPLVFTSYVSRPSFVASVGDELPIASLTAHGIAVLATHAAQTNITSRSGDFRFEIMRVEAPLQAMERLAKVLVEEGLIDGERIGIHGLSYGAEIAMYALWKSKRFRVASVAATSWTPSRFPDGGLNYVKDLEARGFSDPDAGRLENWQQLSAPLNARQDLPPLLVQGADGEQHSTAASWVRFKRAGAQIEWLVYPNEGHVKRNPANKYWVYQRNLDWFRFWLKDEEDPDAGKAQQYARWREMRHHWQASMISAPNR